MTVDVASTQVIHEVKVAPNGKSVRIKALLQSLEAVLRWSGPRCVPLTARAQLSALHFVEVEDVSIAASVKVARARRGRSLYIVGGSRCY